MNIQHILLASGFFILFVLLADSNVSMSVPQISYGDTTVTIEKEPFVFARLPHTATFARSQSEFDSLVLVGDVLLARNVEYLMEQHGTSYPFAGIDLSSFTANPFVIGNFEATVPERHQPTPARTLNFSVSQDYLPALRAAGYSLLSLANNHSMDFGASGYQNTVRTLRAADLKTFGTPAGPTDDSIHFTTVDDTKVAIVALNDLAEQRGQQELNTLFTTAHAKAEFVIAFVHWGTEYADTSSASQRTRAQMYVDAGANLIIGHHPHVVQEVDLIDGVPVVYSLGNYIFDQYFSLDVQTGLIAQIEFDGDPFIHLRPVTSRENLSQPTFMEPNAHNRFLNKLSQKSDPAIAEHVRAGIIPLTVLVATSSKMTMISK